MEPMGLTASRLAVALHVSRQRISEILNGRRGITAETSLRLAKFFRTTAKFWLDLQTDYDLSQAEHLWAPRIDQEIQPLPVVKQNKREKKPASVKLPANQKKIYDLLSEKPNHFDALALGSGMDASELAATLTMLELCGLVRPHPGNRFSKALAEN
jgi:addiction module HigA family antidote